MPTPPLTQPQAEHDHRTYATDYIRADTDQQVWLGSPHVDNLVTVSLALGGEVWATRQRQAIAERLAEKGIAATTANIEAYHPTAEEEKLWETQRQEMALRVYGVLARSLQAPSKSEKVG
jgi:hypothetical protein